MSAEVRKLEPQAMWSHFADLNAVPRPSKKEERVIAFMKNFGESLGLPTTVDHVGNVIIKKPATPGMEDRVTVVIQGHIDMVHQKNATTDFDFNTQGIEMYVDGDWVKAKGTTLGADNGIGVACAMALLSSTDIPHPAIEGLFTIDEETGMTGALELKGGMLDGSILLNLDTEDDDELTIGCAGGVDVTGTGKYNTATVAGLKGYGIAVKGLTGGHSGMDIHRGRGNANKLMNRILYQGAKQFGLRVSSIDGGSLRNAIPRESFAVVGVPAENAAAFEAFIAAETKAILAEHSFTDPKMVISATASNSPEKVFDADFQGKLLRSLYAVPSGIYRMSPDIPGLVQTSNNLARVLIKDGEYTIQCLTRSSVDSEKVDLASGIEGTLELAGAEVTFSGNYPGWAPRPGSAIVELMTELYRDIFKAEPHVNACHAGLECGILGTNYPDMEMISFGPNIRGAHSPDETVQISSVAKSWKLLLAALEKTPKK